MTPPETYEVLGVGPVDMRWITGDGPELPVEIEDEIEYRWQRAVEESDGHLFNGPFLNLIRWQTTPERIEIVSRFADYKRFYVHRQAPHLGLNVRAIGVSGLTILEHDRDLHVVAARRGERMTQYPGLYEFVPSGTIDRDCAEDEGRVRCEAKIIEELHEEAAIPYSAIASVDAFAFTYDRLDDSYDVCCVIRVEATAEAVCAGIGHCLEYTDPVMVPLDELEAWAEELGERLVPVSWGLIEAYRRWTSEYP